MRSASALAAACLVLTACSPSETVQNDRRPLSEPEKHEAGGPAPDATIVDIPMDSVDGNDEVPQDQGVVESDR